MINKLFFGQTINSHWNILNVVDEHNNDTEYIAIRSDFWTKESEDCFLQLIKTKKVIGLSSYQCFPKFIINPYENRGPKAIENTFLLKYNHTIICWLHCFRNPYEYIPKDIPILNFSETDLYPNIKWLNKKANTCEKKYDFICSIQEGQWNDWIRCIDIAKKWLNYMADEMGLKILVCGNNRIKDFSNKITIINFKPWNEFIDILNSAKFLFCCSEYDASPRIIIEALSLNIPVLVNEHILGGWKYINESTGQFFYHNEDINTKINYFVNSKYDCINWINLNLNLHDNSIILANFINNINLSYSNFVDGIIYINLNHRKDRLLQIQNEFTKQNIEKNLLYRLDAVYNKKCGHLGCTMSHIKALSLAKKKKWKNFIIVEDDFIFLLPRQRILHMLKSMNDYKWDVIMLAKGHSQIINTKSDFIKKVDYSTTTSGYICNSNFIDVLYDNFFESFKLLEKEVNESKEIKIYTTKYALDQHWFSLQKKYNFFLFQPITGTQSDSISSIMTIENH